MTHIPMNKCCESCAFKCSKGYPSTCPCHSQEKPKESTLEKARKVISKNAYGRQPFPPRNRQIPHSQPEETTTSDWEEEFRALFPRLSITTKNIDGMGFDLVYRTPEVIQFIRETLAKERTQVYSEGYEEGQKHAFGVDRARVKEEAKKELSDELWERVSNMIAEHEHNPEYCGDDQAMCTDMTREVEHYNTALRDVLALLPEQESK